MHHRSSTKKIVSFTKLPFSALYSGVFFSRTEANHYGEVFRIQGLSFAAEGVARARDCMASDVERAKEVGDTLSVHTCLLPLALISGVNGDSAIALRAAVDAARVTRSAAARHRSLRHLCKSIRCILGVLVGWLEATESILKWEEGTADDEEIEFDENGPDSDDGHWNPKRRCRSAKDLLQTWLRTANLLFWGWRRDVLLYLDADHHSDVTVIKDKVRSWIEDVSSTARMGLRLPMVRWHEHGRSIAEGKGAFLDASAAICERLDYLSGWLHCLDLSLSRDAAKVCERVHAQHLQSQSKNNTNSAAHAGHWPHILGHKTHATQARSNSGTLPTAWGLLLLQRAWLDDAAVVADVRENEAIGKGRGRANHRHGKAAAAATATAVETAVAKGVRYHPAPVAPDSAKTLEGLDARLAVIATLRQDEFPEAIAHEVTLMKYITDNRIDLSLNDSISELLTSVLAPNPFPALTASLALASMAHVLHGVDVDTASRLPALTTCINSKVSGERSASRGLNDDYFAVRGTEGGTAVFGSKPALLGVDADFTLSLFRALPPIASWMLDEPGGDGGSVGVAVGISGCAQQHGSHTYPKVPSELNVVAACMYGYDLRTGATPAERLSRLAVHCALTAHETSPLLVIGLTATTHTHGNNLLLSTTGTLEDRYPLDELLAEPREIEDEISQIEPEEIVLEALMPYPISSGGEALIPLSIRFFLASDARAEHGGEDGDPAEATLLYDCVYSTASAAKNFSTRNSALLESGSAKRHLQDTRRLVLETVDQLDFLEAYRLFHHLRDLRLLVPDDVDIPTASTTDIDDKTWPHRARNGSPGRVGHSEGDDASVTAAVMRMLRGPAGRLHHARRLLGVLRRVVARDDLAPDTLSFLEEKTVKDHAEYSISYLLDTLAEQPMVRFEGAVKSVKLRARLLLDHVRELAERGGSSSGASTPRTAGANATREAASKLADSVVSILHILQIAVEADTHRCHPQVERAFGQLRQAEKREGQKQDSARVGRRAGEPPKKEKGGRVAGNNGRKAAESTSESGAYKKLAKEGSSGGVAVQSTQNKEGV